jgi:hypothetical protein
VSRIAGAQAYPSRPVRWIALRPKQFTAVFAAARRSDDRHFHACKVRIA